MVRGLYTAASGMLAEALRLDVVANNLANVDTVGFKRDRTIAKAFPEMLIRRVNDPVTVAGISVPHAPYIGVLGTGVALEGTYTDMQQGALRSTGRPLDVALLGPGFLAVQYGENELAYTRDGRLHVDAQGWLTDSAGRLVMGMEGPIRIYEPGAEPPETIQIRTDGGVVVDGVLAGQLAQYQFSGAPFLERMGENLWRATEASGEAEAGPAHVEAGALEASNVNVVAEMVKMIQVQRAYEANQRAVQAHDQILERAVNEIASV